MMILNRIHTIKLIYGRRETSVFEGDRCELSVCSFHPHDIWRHIWQSNVMMMGKSISLHFLLETTIMRSPTIHSMREKLWWWFGPLLTFDLIYMSNDLLWWLTINLWSRLWSQASSLLSWLDGCSCSKSMILRLSI